MDYLPGQKKELRQRYRAIGRRWFAIGLMIGLISGLLGGFLWCAKVNVDDLNTRLKKERALVEELKRGYVPPRPEKRG